MFSVTFNNISVLLMEETGEPGENHRLSASLTNFMTYMFHRVNLTMNEIRTHNLSGGRQ